MFVSVANCWSILHILAVSVRELIELAPYQPWLQILDLSKHNTRCLVIYFPQFSVRLNNNKRLFQQLLQEWVVYNNKSRYELLLCDKKKSNILS